MRRSHTYSDPNAGQVAFRPVLKMYNYTFQEYADVHTSIIVCGNGTAAVRLYQRGILNADVRTHASFTSLLFASRRLVLYTLTGETTEFGKGHEQLIRKSAC
jgi:hypothetical protein